MKQFFSLLLLAMASMTLMAQTECEAITSLPWTEDFEGMAAGEVISAECWTNEHIAGDGTDLFKVSNYFVGDNLTLKGELPDMAAGTITRLGLPLMDFGQPKTCRLSIDVYRYSDSESYAKEGLRIFAGEEELGFISRCYAVADGDRVPAEATSGWYTCEFVIPVGGEQHIFIQGESRFGNTTYFDNLVVKVNPTALEQNAASGALRAEKIIRDGHIYIVLPDGTTFDAIGRVVRN